MILMMMSIVQTTMIMAVRSNEDKLSATCSHALQLCEARLSSRFGDQDNS